MTPAEDILLRITTGKVQALEERCEKLEATIGNLQQEQNRLVEMLTKAHLELLNRIRDALEVLAP